MIINKKVNLFYLNLFAVILVSALLFAGCGKKESTQDKTDNKQEQTSGNKTESNIGENTSVHYILQAQGEMVGKWDIYAQGKKAKVNLDLTIAGKETHSEMYTDGTMMYMVSEVTGKKTGFKMDVSKFAEQNAKKGEFNPMNFKEGCKDCEKVGTEDVLGRSCTIYQDKKGNKYWVFQDKYPLKIEMEKTTITAKSFDTDVKVSDDMFTPPKDVEYSDMDKMLEGLKNPKDLKNMEEQLNKMKK